jgi:hypothetical protein
MPVPPTRRGARLGERPETPPPGGDPARLNGKPMGLRYAWRDPSKLLGHLGSG